MKENIRLHSFSIEVKNRNSVNKISILGESTEALIEGQLGEHIHIEVVEGILLQIIGDNGVFRLDLNEGESDDLIHTLLQTRQGT